MSEHTPTLVVTEDVQGRAMPGTRCGPAGWLVYTPATGPGLAQDLVQRGLFWRRADADLFAAAPELLEFVESILTTEDWDYDDWKYKARAAIAKARGIVAPASSAAPETLDEPSPREERT